jgi:diaminopimelate epimerase
LRTIEFVKMQGLGNDFVVVEGPVGFTPDEVAEVCDRRFGVGADGVLVVSRGDPPRMEYWNADGSAAEMCGNGLRCVARYVYDHGWVRDRNFTIQTPIGERTTRVLEDDVEVELGRAVVGGDVTIGGRAYVRVEVGNPHVVAFVDDPAEVDVAGLGPSVQAEFPAGVNVEFVEVMPDRVRMRVWERGVGETMACGTGMAAAAAAAGARHGVDGPVLVEVPGGVATVELRDGVAWMRGPAEYSFRGSVGER